MTAPTVDERLTTLESDFYRSTRQRTQQRLEHVTGALGELSQGARSMGLDIREIRADINDMKVDINGINGRLGGMEADINDVKTLLQAIASKVGVIPRAE